MSIIIIIIKIFEIVHDDNHIQASHTHTGFGDLDSFSMSCECYDRKEDDHAQWGTADWN